MLFSTKNDHPPPQKKIMVFQTSDKNIFIGKSVKKPYLKQIWIIAVLYNNWSAI